MSPLIYCSQRETQPSKYASENNYQDYKCHHWVLAGSYKCLLRTQDLLTRIHHSVHFHQWAHIFLSLCKCVQVQEFKKVFSNKYCPTENFHSATPQSRYQTNMTGRLESEKGEARWAELRCQSTDVYLLYYRVFTAVQMCVCQALTVNFWARVEAQPSAVWELSGWVVLMAAWGYCRAGGMCVSAWNSCSL